MGNAVIDRQNGAGDIAVRLSNGLRRKGAPLALSVLLIALSLVFAASLYVDRASFSDVVLAAVLCTTVILAGRALARPDDAHWLRTAVAAGFLAKLIASGARYWALISIYHGVGDASGYHIKGLRMADVWRSFQIPEIGTGTDFIPPAAGLLYAPYKPSMLGGFFLFASLAFVGQLFMLAGFRYVSTPLQFKWYAAAILFLPTILYWPSSIGKEALMFLFIGPVVYGTARLLSDYRVRWSIPIGVGLIGAGIIRAHIAFLLAVALLLAVAVAKAPAVSAAGAKRVLLLATSGVVLVAAVLATSERFGFDLSAGASADVVAEEVDPFLEDLSERTEQGGSAVEGGLIRNLADIPEATVRVLFRPLPWEATNIQTLVASLEGAILLGLVLIRLPAMLKTLFHIRRRPYALFSLVFMGGFVFAFSAILNLGILARQRSQVMPFLMSYLILASLRDKPMPVDNQQPPESLKALVPVQ